MNNQQSVIHRFFTNSLYKGIFRSAEKNDTHTGSQRYSWRSKPVVNVTTELSEANDQDGNTGITVANREVYLDGYKTHEEVVRAYLEFAGIDPESKEGQLYFKL
jgi:hypothetical protein